MTNNGKRLLALLGMAVFIPSMAYADGAKEAFARINSCVRTQDAQSCRDLFTASSTALYDRFISYDLLKCLPHDVSYISQKPAGSAIIIRAGTMVQGQQRTMRLVFVEEEGQWKLDAPESLHTAMGEHWQSNLDLTEQLYLLLKQQMGDRLNCEMITHLGQNLGQNPGKAK